MVRHVDLKQITHYKLTWNCDCIDRNTIASANLTDAEFRKAYIECIHMPKKELDYIELVPADLKSELDMMFEPALSKGNIFDEKDKKNFIPAYFSDEEEE